MEVFASAPQQPGFTFTAINYFDSVSANGSVAASREITIGKLGPNVNVNLNVAVSAKVDVVLPYLNYVFASRVFGGQLALGMFSIIGNNSSSLDGTLTLASGPFAVTRQGTFGQSAFGYGDLYPVASLRWNDGVHNWMVATYPLANTIPPALPTSASGMEPPILEEAIRISIP